MPPPAAPRIDPIRPPAVRRAERAGQTVRRAQRQNEVDVVRHQAIGPNLNLRPAHLFGQDVAIDVLVSVLEKDRLAPISPRGHVVRATGSDNAGEPSHPQAIAHSEQNGNIVPVPVFADNRI
jgi:hypothetical protein